MTFYCPECERSLARGDINRKDALAICNDCDIVFDISQQLRSHRRHQPGQTPVRERIALPHGFRVERPPGEGGGAGAGMDAGGPFRGAGRARTDVVVAWPAFGRVHRAVAALAAAWVVFVVVGLWRYGFSWMTVPHVALAAGLIVFVVAGLINRVEIAVAGDVLEIRRGPLPRWRVTRLPAGGVRQIYCKRYILRRAGRRSAWAFEVIAQMRGQSPVRLVPRLERREQALYVEQLLEECLLITDVEVAGELRRM